MFRSVPKDKKTGLPKKYVPASLSTQDKKKQVKSIVEGTVRPKVESFKPRRSRFVIAFEKRYGTKITDDKFISKNIIAQKGIDEILDKGRGAYFSGGSRPNQTPESWARARLASVIMNGNARKVDMAIWKRYKK